MASRRLTILAAGVLVGGWYVALPGGAAAATGSTVAVTGAARLVFTGGDEANHLVVTDRFGPADFFVVQTFHDVVPITPGQGCSWPDPDDRTLVECEFFEQPTTETSLTVRLGGGDDEVLVDDVSGENAVYGGPGRDRIDGRDVDRMFGEDGDDTLFPRGSADGGPGNDVMTGTGLMRGGDGDDRITGNQVGNHLEGGRGDDTIRAGGGKDLAYGNSGNDLIQGGTESDRLYGGPGADVVYGNSGNDLVAGGPGNDHLSGGPGNDKVQQ